MAKKHTEQESAAKTTGRASAKKTAPAPAKTKKTAISSKAKKTSSVKKTAPAKKAAGTKVAVPVPPTEQEENIRVAAYYLWEQRGKIHGSDVQDWLEAEKTSAE